MTRNQKKEAERLREIEGWSFGAIARHLGLAKSTVASHIERKKRRNQLNIDLPMIGEKKKTYCLCCGKELQQLKGKKVKRFCNKKCTDIYYNHQRRNKNINDNK